MLHLLAEGRSFADIVPEALRRFTPIAIGAAVFGALFWFWIKVRVRRKLAEKLAQRDQLMEKARQQQKRRAPRTAPAPGANPETPS